MDEKIDLKNYMLHAARDALRKLGLNDRKLVRNESERKHLVFAIFNYVMLSDINYKIIGNTVSPQKTLDAILNFTSALSENLQYLRHIDHPIHHCSADLMIICRSIKGHETTYGGLELGVALARLAMLAILNAVESSNKQIEGASIGGKIRKGRTNADPDAVKETFEKFKSNPGWSKSQAERRTAKLYGISDRTVRTYIKKYFK